MLKYCSKKIDWNHISICSLFLTVIGGLFLRLQYAGYVDIFSHLDLRRSHSHLGFYGILFPLMWHQLRGRFWIPKGLFVKIYMFLLLVATVGFATAGYGTLAHISSFCTLVIWLIFAFKNIKRVRKIDDNFLNVIPLAIILSSIFILLLLAFRAGELIAPLVLVRVFLITLLFGVFAPLAFVKISENYPPSVLWIVGVLGFGLVMTGLFSKIFMVMPAMLAILIFISFAKQTKWSLDEQNRIRLYWHVLASVLLLIAINVIPNNHLTAVSGVHFFVFLIIIPTFFEFQKRWGRATYDVASLLMVSLIYSQNIIIWSYPLNQVMLAWVSLALVGILCTGLNSKQNADMGAKTEVKGT